GLLFRVVKRELEIRVDNLEPQEPRLAARDLHPLDLRRRLLRFLLRLVRATLLRRSLRRWSLRHHRNREHDRAEGGRPNLHGRNTSAWRHSGKRGDEAMSDLHVLLTTATP